MDFTGKKEIIEVEISDNNLGIESILSDGVSSEIKSAVDILCTKYITRVLSQAKLT